MKQIQIWLGHSTFATTADIYAHLDFSAQEQSAAAMGTMFTRKESPAWEKEKAYHGTHGKPLAEEVGVEPTRRSPDLRDFESRLFTTWVLLRIFQTSVPVDEAEC